MGKGGGGSKVGGRGISTAMTYLGQTTKPRNMMFRQLASALSTGGGKGFKMPFVQEAMRRSRTAGVQALAGAGNALQGVDSNVRSRILNRIGRQNMQTTASIGPRVAGQLINAAPGMIAGSGGPVLQGMGIAAAGEESALRNQAIRGQGFSALASGLASAAGSAAGALKPAATTSAEMSRYGPYAGAYQMPPSGGGGSWFSRFKPGGA